MYFFQDYLFEFARHDLDRQVRQVSPAFDEDFLNRGIVSCLWLQIRVLSLTQRILNVLEALKEVELARQTVFAQSQMKA